MFYKYFSLYVLGGSTPPTKLNPVCDPDNVDAKHNDWDNNDNDFKQKHGPLTITGNLLYAINFYS